MLQCFIVCLNKTASHTGLYTVYYRADTFLRRGTGDVSMIEESQNLSLFLANQNKITFLLKEGLEAIQGYDDVLADVLILCVRLYESNMYITPNDKHVLLKVLYIVPCFLLICQFFRCQVANFVC